MVLIFLLVFCQSLEEYSGDSSGLSISYYSVIKLQHESSKLYLSSLGVLYVNGSNQQMTRGINKGILSETFWSVYPLPNESFINQGEPVQCGSQVRFKHSVTGKFLHSHQIEGPFGHGYEVSVFNGNDSGDYWTIECGDIWSVSSSIHIQHSDTKMYLSANLNNEYKEEQGGGFEIFSDDNEWSVQGGLFVGEE